MSLAHFFQHRDQHLRMYEFEFEYRNGRGEHEVTLAYVVAGNETKAKLELKQQLAEHHCELLEIKGFAKRIEPAEFDAYVHHNWPEHLKTLVAKQMIRDHDHHVYVLPPIKIID